MVVKINKKGEHVFRSEATNAYDLLKEIRALIQEEPKRYNQQDTLTYLRNYRNTLYRGKLAQEVAPACGTIGCRAGWVVAAAAPHPERVDDVVHYAKKVLGLTGRQAENLFDGWAAGSEADGAPFGSVEHARRGARGITVFMAHHKKQLQAHKITPRA